jgi:hypothetical protein
MHHATPAAPQALAVRSRPRARRFAHPYTVTTQPLVQAPLPGRAQLPRALGARRQPMLQARPAPCFAARPTPADVERCRSATLRTQLSPA